MTTRRALRLPFILLASLSLGACAEAPLELDAGPGDAGSSDAQVPDGTRLDRTECSLDGRVVRCIRTQNTVGIADTYSVSTIELELAQLPNASVTVGGTMNLVELWYPLTAVDLERDAEAIADFTLPSDGAVVAGHASWSNQNAYRTPIYAPHTLSGQLVFETPECFAVDLRLDAVDAAQTSGPTSLRFIGTACPE